MCSIVTLARTLSFCCREHPFEDIVRLPSYSGLVAPLGNTFMDMIAATCDERPPPTLARRSHARELPDEELLLDDGDEEKVLATLPASEPAGSSDAPHPKAKKTKTKRVKPVIDLDDHIRKAQDAIKLARKQVQQARVQAKLEKRKKQRLLRKASNLNVEDLERIAVLKRCSSLMASQSASAESGHAAPEAAASAEASGSSKKTTPGLSAA